MLAIRKSYKLCDHIILKNVNEKFWALSTNSGDQFRLNELSYMILNEIVHPNSIDNIVKKILTVYNVSAKEASQDCMSLLKDAIKMGLVEEVTI